jgi:hypothetical protein
MRNTPIAAVLWVFFFVAGQALALPDLVVTDIELIPGSPAPETGTLRGVGA